MTPKPVIFHWDQTDPACAASVAAGRQTHQKDQTHQIDQIHQIHQTDQINQADLSREIYDSNSEVYPVAPEDGTGAYFTGTKPTRQTIMYAPEIQSSVST